MHRGACPCGKVGGMTDPLLARKRSPGPQSTAAAVVSCLLSPCSASLGEVKEMGPDAVRYTPLQNTINSLGMVSVAPGV